MATRYDEAAEARTPIAAAPRAALSFAANDGDRRRSSPALPHDLARVFAHGVVGVVRGSIRKGPDWANDSFLAMSGYDRHEIEAGTLDWVAMTPPEWLPTDVERLAAARHAGYSATYEKEFWRKDGSRWPVIVGFTIDADETDLVTVFVVDLTASKLAETARRDADRHYARFFEVSKAAFWTADASGRVSFVSQTTADRLGTDAELDNPEDQAALIHPDDRAFAVATWARSMAEGSAYDIEVRARGMDGAPYRWTRLQAFPDRVDGHVTGWYGTSDDVHERRAATEALVESEARFKRLADDAPAMIWLTDAKNRTTYLSRGWHDYTGQTDAEALAFGWMAAIHPDDRARLTPVRATVAARTSFDLDFRLRRHDGEYRWMLSSGRPRGDDNNDVAVGYVGCITDIHARKVAERDLASIQQRLSQALDGTGVGVWEWDAATDTVMISGSALHISGFRNVDVDYIPIDYHRMVHRDDSERFFKAMADYVAGHTTEFAVEMRIRTKDGGWVWVLDRGTALDRDAQGRALRMVGTLTNIEDSKRAEAKLRWIVEHDALTGLANRTLFNQRLEAALAAAGGKNMVALALLDIDDFKAVNDVLGHAAGDALLVVLAERLRDFAYPDETVARLGGDEFTILIPACRDADHVTARLETLRARLAQPFLHDGHTLTCRSSIGVTLAPCQGRDASALLKNADIAMYSSKSLRRGAVTMFEPALGAQVRRDATALQALRDALEAGWIKPCYQPVVRIVSGAVIGCEALAHIDHGGAIEPLDASVAGEDADLAVRLGDAMLDAVLADLSGWRTAGLVTGRVAINVSSVELRRGDYAERFLARLASAGVAPSLLRIEVLETVLLGRGAERSAAALATLSAAGVCITLDDFGTGYASLTHLTRLTLGAIKIDRSFVRQVGSGGGHAIVSAITGLGANLGLAVIADGVADAVQAEVLAGLGCAFAQGTYFHHALSSRDVTTLLASPLGPRAAAA